jgi:hypothetical protein
MNCDYSCLLTTLDRNPDVNVTNVLLPFSLLALPLSIFQSHPVALTYHLLFSTMVPIPMSQTEFFPISECFLPFFGVLL